MKNTENYGFNLPEKSDFFNLEHYNTNFEEIDEKLKELEAGGDFLPLSGGEMTGTLVTTDVKPSANATFPMIGRKGNAYFGGYFNNLAFETSNGADAGSVATMDDISGDGTTNAIIMSLGNDDTNTFGGIDVRSPSGGHANVTASGSGSAEIYFPPNSGTLALQEETLPLTGGTVSGDIVVEKSEDFARIELKHTNRSQMARLQETLEDSSGFNSVLLANVDKANVANLNGIVIRPAGAVGIEHGLAYRRSLNGTTENWRIFHGGNSRGVHIASTAPSDTSYLWVW